MERQTITSFDGTPISMMSSGPEDAPALVMANGVGGTWLAFKYLHRAFEGRFRFLSWDYRGLYASGRPMGGYDALTVPAHTRDLIAVLDAAKADRAHVFGWSMGVQVAIEAWRSASDRILSFVLHNGVAGRPYDSMLGHRRVGAVVERLLGLLQRNDSWSGRLLGRAVDTEALVPLLIRLGIVHHELDRDLFTTMARGFKTIDLHLYMELLRRLGEHDASDLLPSITAPTLMIAGSADLMTPVSRAEEIAREVQHGELIVVAAGTHYAAVELPELVTRPMERFYRRIGALQMPAGRGGAEQLRA